MGMYTYINDNDRINMRKVKDIDIKEVFEEALKFDPSLMISEFEYSIKKLFRKPIKKSTYTVYHEQFSESGKPLFEARVQLSASGSRDVVIAYLYGIINGNLNNNKETNAN